MNATIELPKAFSFRDESHLTLLQDLMTRLSPKLIVVQVATGMHVDGGSTANWGVVYHDDGKPLSEAELHSVLAEAGFDLQHNAEIQPSRIWVSNEAQAIEESRA